ncbi:MAG TPA: hypothetical protein VER76_11560, partial [Pyrinomonadaceae bacterium]|nr:hypothetical protein [Pyrinomonadaceae bacterium]
MSEPMYERNATAQREPQGARRPERAHAPASAPRCNLSAPRRMPRTLLHRSLMFLACVCLLLVGETSFAQARRLVVVKVDGLSQATLDRFVV